jgi:hypothetical protein
MKAVVYPRFCGPVLSQNSVLVRVRAAALNPADHLLQAHSTRLIKRLRIWPSNVILVSW